MNRRLLTTRRFTVEERVFSQPGRKPISRCIVVHPGAVVILPIPDDEHIVMIRQVRHGIGEEIWELPAGTREPDEAAIDTARRELEEETGYRAGRMERLTGFYSSPGICTEWMESFVAFDLQQCGQKLEDGETIVAETFALAEALRMLLSGGIRDGKTIATLGHYLLKRGGA